MKGVARGVKRGCKELNVVARVYMWLQVVKGWWKGLNVVAKGQG